MCENFLVIRTPRPHDCLTVRLLLRITYSVSGYTHIALGILDAAKI